jgi:hypothetical protein
MRKMIYLLAAAAALILAGVGAWAVSTTYARVIVPEAIVRIDTYELTKGAENLPVQHFKDFSLVFD